MPSREPRPEPRPEPKSYTVTWLEMATPPARLPPRPADQDLALIEAADPPVAYFLYLYTTVGRDWYWDDWHNRPEAEVAAFVGDPQVTLTTLLVEGWPGGFFMLDTRQAGVCDLAYFGLVPQAIGRGLGAWLLGEAVAAAWARPGVSRLSVNTCTLDHPRALGNYRRLGFEPVRVRTIARP
ncbi:MAG: GNAT family N-acetyltransferase [Pseudomonadota bacterium]